MTNEDKELLELAAKAAGIKVRYWDPLGDDSDAFRLAVTLKLEIIYNIEQGYIRVRPTTSAGNRYYYNITDPAWSVRKAIVCEAAEIGRSMK